MGTKVKGLLKGLRYISQIFDEPKKEDEFQIGLPTDVKHVAHIGCNDGPAATVDSSPSWMKDFESTEGVRQSAPACEDSSKQIVHRATNSLGNDDLSDKPKSTRRASSLDDSPKIDSPEKEKSRQPRRHRRKDSSGNSKLSQDGNVVSDSSGSDLPDIPKKNRRKKSKDSSSTRSSRSRGSGSGSSSGSGSGSGSGLEPDSSNESLSSKDKESSEAES